jgi:hypothetical protein
MERSLVDEIRNNCSAAQLLSSRLEMALTAWSNECSVQTGLRHLALLADILQQRATVPSVSVLQTGCSRSRPATLDARQPNLLWLNVASQLDNLAMAL